MVTTSLSYLLLYSIAYQHFDYSDSNHQFFCLHSWIFATCVSTWSNLLPPKQPTKNEKKRPPTRVLWAGYCFDEKQQKGLYPSMFCPDNKFLNPKKLKAGSYNFPFGCNFNSTLSFNLTWISSLGAGWNLWEVHRKWRRDFVFGICFRDKNLAWHCTRWLSSWVVKNQSLCITGGNVQL